MYRGLTFTSATMLIVACCALGAQDADRAQAEALSRRGAERLRALHEEADRLASDERTLLNELRKLELERQIRTEELGQSERDAAITAGELAALDRQIAAIEEQEAAARPAIDARLVGLYKLGRGKYVRLLLSTTSIRQLGQASRMVGALSDLDRKRLAAHRQRLADLAVTRKTLEDRQTRLTALRADSARAKAAAEQAVAARNALIRDIDERRDLNAQLAGELQVAQGRLQATLSSLTSGGPGAAVALPIGPFRGDLEWPAAGALRQRFGIMDSTRAPSTGIDIAADEGREVQAVHDGVVAFADTFAGFGRLVIIDHGSQAFSLYGNLKDISVAKGAAIGRGDLIGTVGVSATGATGLYFELRIDARPVDPLQWLRKK